MLSASKTAAPSGSVPNPQFNYVTMLLHGDGTNGAQNNTFLDSSTNNFTITRNGNTTQGSFSPYGSNWSNYITGGQYLSTPAGVCNPSSSDFTFEFWYFPNANTSRQYFISSASDYWFALSCNLIGSYSLEAWASSNGTSWDLLAGDGIANAKSVANVFVPNQWNHIAFSRTGNNWAVFANGVRVITVTGVSGTVIARSSEVRNIGNLVPYGMAVNGYLSNVRFVIGSSVYSANSSTLTVPTTPLTSITNTQLLTCQSNRFKDNSSNNYTLAVTGTPSVQRFNPFGTSTAYSTSVIGGSGYFDGSGDYLAISNGGGSALDMGTGNCTIEMWAYPDTQSTSFPSMFAPKTGWSSGTFYIRYQGSKFGIYWNGVGDPFFESTNTYPPNAWYHVALVRSGTTFTLYVNGVSAGTGTSSATLNLAIGGEVWLGNNTSASCYYKGLLSDVRVVKGTAVYTSAFTPPTSPLTAISGTSLLTNMTNGAIFDNAMMNDLETVGNAQISTSVVKYGTGSLAFDGTGDWLTQPITSSITLPASSDFTIECWFRANNFTTNVGTIYSNDVGDCYLAIRNAQIEFGSKSGSQYAYTIPSPSTSTWYHLALCRSGSTCYVFLNGTAVITQTGATVTNSFLYGTTFYIGNYAGNTGAGYSYNGYIDEFRITNGYARYTTTFTPPTAAFSDNN